jgi:hypothetical protein
LSYSPDAGVHDEGGWYANPRINYQYEVDGQIYRSSGVNPSSFNYLSEDQFTDETRGFDKGRSIRCWYDPASPATAYVVNRGITASPVLLSIFGIVLCIVSRQREKLGDKSPQDAHSR